MSNKDPVAGNAGSKVIRLVRVLIGIVVFIALLFLSAGRLDWLEGWVFLIVFFAYVLFLWVWIFRNDPELVKERRRLSPDAKGWDKKIIRIYTFVLFTMLVVAGLDSGRFRWAVTPVSARIIGWLGLVVAMVLVWWCMSVNTYLSRVVRIQDDRGQRVVTTGPYKYVRHPMYVGTILSAFCTPIVLGSWWAVVPGGLIAVLFIIRTALEDRTLREELRGYSEYAERVRYRLVPRIW